MMSLPPAGSSQPRLSHARFDHAKAVVGTRQGDSTVLLDVKGGMYYTLNEVGGRIWELLGSGMPAPAIVERLQEDYDVAPEKLAMDTAAMIDRLLRARLIVQAAP